MKVIKNNSANLWKKSKIGSNYTLFSDDDILVYTNGVTLSDIEKALKNQAIIVLVLIFVFISVLLLDLFIDTPFPRFSLTLILFWIVLVLGGSLIVDYTKSKYLKSRLEKGIQEYSLDLVFLFTNDVVNANRKVENYILMIELLSNDKKTPENLEFDFDEFDYVINDNILGLYSVYVNEKAIKMKFLASFSIKIRIEGIKKEFTINFEDFQKIIEKSVFEPHFLGFFIKNFELLQYDWKILIDSNSISDNN